MTENLFASGELKKTSDNIAIADRIVRRAERTRGNQAAGGVMAAQRFLNMTPMQALTGLVAGVFIGVGTLIRKAQSI